MLVALRIGRTTYTSEAILNKYLDMVKTNLDVVDEVTLFAGGSHHGYTPRKDTIAEADLLVPAIKKYKELLDAGIISKALDGVKVLGNGELTKKITVKAARVTEGAAKKIEAAGGKVEVI